MTYDFNVLNQICYIFCIFLPPPVYIYFDLSLTFWLFSGGWHDQHWTDWNNKWYMRVQWQWINAARFGWKPDTFILHTCSGACSQMVFLPRKFNGLISRCYWLLFLKFSVSSSFQLGSLFYWLVYLLDFVFTGRAGGGCTNNHIWWFQISDKGGPWEVEFDKFDWY